MRIQSERVADERLLSQKISGVKAAHVQASTKASVIGPAGEDITRPKPKSRASSRRFTEETVASAVQNKKMSAISRALSSKRSEPLMRVASCALRAPASCSS